MYKRGPSRPLFSGWLLSLGCGHLRLKEVQLCNREVGSKTGCMMLGFFVFEVLIKTMNELTQHLLVAFCLMLILEGIVPFLYPQKWRKLVVQLGQISDRHMRLIGLVSMLFGLALLLFIR